MWSTAGSMSAGWGLGSACTQSRVPGSGHSAAGGGSSEPPARGAEGRPFLPGPKQCLKPSSSLQPRAGMCPSSALSELGALPCPPLVALKQQERKRRRRRRSLHCTGTVEGTCPQQCCRSCLAFPCSLHLPAGFVSAQLSGVLG